VALEQGEPDLAEAWTARLETRLDELLAALGKSRGDFAREPKSAPWKVALAAEMKASTTATNQWLAEPLAMGSPFQVSRLASACRAEPGAAAPFLRMMRSGRRRQA
jgi:hypothetical protein